MTTNIPECAREMMTDVAIEAFVSSFEDCSLPRSEWTHGKHLVMALWYLRRHPKHEATRRIREGIRRYNLSQGNLTGYHETVTLAWIEVIERFLVDRDHARPVADLARELLTACGDKAYLFRFYSRDLLLSDEARRRWVPPDRKPFE
jgi:hypothetical protein